MTTYDPEKLINDLDGVAPILRHVTATMAAEHARSDQYSSLRAVLDAAYAQAADGKGQERHASDGQAFEDQPIMTIARRRGLGFLLGQADEPSDRHD